MSWSPGHFGQLALAAAAFIAANVHVTGDVVSIAFTVPGAVATALIAGLTVLGLVTASVSIKKNETALASSDAKVLADAKAVAK